MKGAIVAVKHAHQDDFVEFEQPESYDVLTPQGPGTVTLNQDVIFCTKNIGMEWYAVQAITDQTRRVVICPSRGQSFVYEDPLFECKLVARSPLQKENPTYVVERSPITSSQVRPIELGDTVLISGNTIASKALAIERSILGAENPSAPTLLLLQL